MKTVRTVLDLLAGEPDLAFYARDRQLRITDANTAFAQLCGRASALEITGKTNEQLFPRFLAQAYVAAEQSVLSSGQPATGTILFPDSRGIATWSRVIRCPLRDNRGIVNGVAGLIRGLEATRVAFEPYLTIAPAVESMQRNYRRPLRLTEIASMVDLSVRQFERRFLHLLGMPPQQFVIHIRIVTGCQLLTDTDLPVAEIASQLGFSDHSGFTRHFSRLIGQSPLRYRQTFRPPSTNSEPPPARNRQKKSEL